MRLFLFLHVTPVPTCKSSGVCYYDIVVLDTRRDPVAEYKSVAGWRAGSIMKG